MEELINAFWNSFWKVCQTEFQNVKVTNLLIFTLAGACMVHMGCVIYVKCKRRPIQLTTEILILLLISYGIFISYVSVFSRAGGSQPRVFQTKLLWVDPLMDQNMTNLLNVILFVPYGMILTGLQLDRQSRMRSFMVANYCFLTSLLIEGIQYITRRGYCEIDDIEANVLGGVVGSLAINLCVKIGELIRKNTEDS